MATGKAQYNASIEVWRNEEYPMIQDSVYLDHAGTTLCSKSLMEEFAREMTITLYGNPHSGSWPSQVSTTRIDDIRLQLLQFFGADPRDFDLVFVANATAGVKLVVDGLRSMPGGFAFIHHEACHTSVIGAREESVWSECLGDAAVHDTLNDGILWAGLQDGVGATLFAYSAQSHLDGRRYPLSWSEGMRKSCPSRLLSLLDASSLCATSPLDLSNADQAPDFTVLSLYKIFGFPDLGALIVRKSASDVFTHRKYFGGGTVDMVVCGGQPFHSSKSTALHDSLEDGTLPFHNIVAAGTAIRVHTKLFGSMDDIRAHSTYLTASLVEGLRSLRHGNGTSVCQIYGRSSSDTESTSGPNVAFNIRDSRGSHVSLAEFEKLANLKKMYVRTGTMCSPAGIASALDLDPWELRKLFSAGFRCGSEHDVVGGKPTGVIRASLGPMSIRSDVTRFVDFIAEYFVETTQNLPEPPATTYPSKRQLRIRSIAVFPIKSCGSFTVPPGTDWEVRAEGLAWDRQWCLVHRGSNQALSQKRYPRMALIRPSLDLEAGLLRVKYLGSAKGQYHPELTIPLAEDASLYDKPSLDSPSRVCGEAVSILRYASPEINDFFSEALGVQCVLSRMPPGGCGLNSRMSKARLQAHQRKSAVRFPGSFPGVPSPPDSEEEILAPSKILLSNESPILMVYSKSIDQLNKDVLQAGGQAVADATFRANLVVEPASGEDSPPAYEEDQWETLTINQQQFRFLGSCRRCQMVCVDQETGEKGLEPLNTLAKMRKFDGKVFFGTHMRYEPTTGRFGDRLKVVVRVGDIGVTE